MVKPQQPELRRSDRGGTSDDATKERLTAPSAPGVDRAAGGVVPEDNQPGHHPPVEQDKPSGRDFVAKTHALAHEDEYDPPSMENEVIDLTQIPADGVHHDGGTGSRVASLVGMPFAVAGSVLKGLRDRLP